MLDRPWRLAFAAPLLIGASARAQLDILQPPPSLPSLPEPATVSHLLLESPVPVAIGAIALALGAFAVANRLGRARLALALGAGLAGLGVVAVLVSFAVQTPRERVIETTRSLVASVAQADGAALSRVLDAEVRLNVRGSGAGWDKARILDWVESNLAAGHTFAVAHHRVSEVQAEIGPSGQVARSRADVVITPSGDAPPTRFVCMLTWRKSETGDWSLVQIDPLWLQGWGEISSGDMLRERDW